MTKLGQFLFECRLSRMRWIFWESMRPVNRRRLVAGEPCPCCGVKYRPRMTDAERQRRYRERKKRDG